MQCKLSRPGSKMLGQTQSSIWVPVNGWGPEFGGGVGTLQTPPTVSHSPLLASLCAPFPQTSLPPGPPAKPGSGGWCVRILSWEVMGCSIVLPDNYLSLNLCWPVFLFLYKTKVG